jgi:predicted ATPase with chaperone activity
MSNAQPALSDDLDIEQRIAELTRRIAAANEGDDLCWAIAARQPKAGPVRRLEELPPGGPAASPPPPEAQGKFLPLAPATIEESGLSESEVQALVLRLLLNRGCSTGNLVATRIGLPFALIHRLLQLLKSEQIVHVKGATGLADFSYELTSLGVDRAKRFSAQCTYFGVAPVALPAYAVSVERQSLRNLKPNLRELRRAFADLTLGDAMLQRLGRAIHGGRGAFLYGAPGNGKTSIAERITQAYGGSIWIPRAISVWGEIIRLFDPSNHVEMPVVKGERLYEEEQIDQRWVRIRRPTVIAGGELTLDRLEITANRETGIGEAPLQLKSNCGTLVIDDFGRQRVAPADLLNRWIVPLEKQYDFLNVPSGRKIQVPFQQFVVFSTNLEPRDLVDEAFLRRIPYKVEVADPTEAEYRSLFDRTARDMKIETDSAVLDYLVQRHYRDVGRQLRFCHPRDLLRQVLTYFSLLEQSPRLTREAIDAAADDYFSIV